MRAAPWPTLNKVLPRMTRAERASSKFFGLAVDSRIPSANALAGVIESMPAIHFGSSARSPFGGLFCHCLTASANRSAPTATRITPVVGEDRLELGSGNSQDKNAKKATATAMPTTQPSSRATLVLLGFGDSSSRTVEMMVVGLIAIPIASGSISPNAVPMRISLRGKPDLVCDCHTL